MVTSRIEIGFTVERKGDLHELVVRIDKGLPMLPEKFAKNVQEFARLKAPIRTGELVKSIEVTPMADGSYEVIVNAFYGIYVNYGTRYMHAQPFWEPAINAAIIELRKDIQKVLHG